MTVEAVVARSGIAKSTLYRHWPSRADLLIDVLSTLVPPINVDPDAAGFVDALRELLTELARAFGDPQFSRVLPSMLALRLYDPEVAAVVDRFGEEMRSSFALVLEAGRRQGVVRDQLAINEVLAHLVGPLMFAVIDLKVDPVGLVAPTIEHFLSWATPDARH